MNTINQITPREAHEALKNGALLIDVRTAPEIADCSFDVETQQHIPLNQLVARLGEIKKEQKVIFACASGARSASAVSYLMQNGYQNVYNLQGGIYRWQRENLPVNFG